MNRFFIFVVVALVFAGCGEKAEPSNGKTNELTGVNAWMRAQLEQWYYWQDALVSSKAPNGSLAYTDFLEQSLLYLDDARDADGTMDGKVMRGERYLYSRIDRISGGTRASASEQNTYGFGVIVVPFTGGASYAILVTWVLPGGPAEEAGLARGMIMSKYNGADIHLDDVSRFGDQLFSQSTRPMELTDERGVEYTIEGKMTRIDPIIEDRVIETEGGRKVAYLMYNAFEQGETSGVNEFGEFDRELRYVFAGFKDAGAEELVLDLRYNGGGAVISSQLLSSLAGNVRGGNNGEVFTRMRYNDDMTGENPRIMRFLDEPASLELDRVYVLATGDTASSSELLVNSLRGVDVDVVIIGERTEGKNVGMNQLLYTEGMFRYEFWPITFKSSNAKDFSDYSGGFEPDVRLDELAALFEQDRGKIYDFGDPRDRLLGAALTMIDGGTVADDPVTRARGRDDVIRVRNPRAGGARVYTLPERE